VSNSVVSIIIPLHNSENYIGETLQSALNQTWPHKELIIIDDGSSDSSLSIAKSFESHEVKVYSQPQRGASAARNFGLKVAKGDYIQFLDADDLLDSKKIENQITILENTPDSLAFGKCIHFFGEDGNFEHIEQYHPQLEPRESNIEFIKKLYGAYNHIPGSMIEVHSWLSPRLIIEKAGYWNEMLSVDDDGEYFLRVLLTAKKVLKVDSSISYYRKRKNSTSLAAQVSKRNGFQSAIKSLDLKYWHLQSIVSKPELEAIFGKMYWEKAVFAYPQFIDEYAYCSRRAKELNYNGPSYIGGPNATRLSKIFGWKAVKCMQYLQRLLKKQHHII
jgi:glycosyltransferase involved in cell wall biosynthesis